jgi:hypothetical protein
MSEFNEKYREYESKNKKANRNGVILLISGLFIFSGLFIYNIYTKNQKQKDTEIILEYNNIQINEREKQDSIEYANNIKREHSRELALEQVQTKIEEIKKEKGLNNNIKQKINSLQSKVNTMQLISQDTIIVRYYKRKADIDNVEKAIKSVSELNFYLHYRDVPNDTGFNKVNTLYHGSNVKISYVDLLYKQLLKNNLEINKKPFASARGFEWKQDAMEIGFEKKSSKTDENSKIYVRIYSFRPNKKIKFNIRNKLEAKGFQVKLYPDWPDKPSFFSDESTVLYYHNSNNIKAKLIAETLTVLTKGKPKFQYKKGKGYGVSEEEKKEIFIIHYNGSQ